MNIDFFPRILTPLIDGESISEKANIFIVHESIKLFFRDNNHTFVRLN